MATTKLKTQFVFAPLTRVDEDNRIVEGYAFVNPSVKGDTYSVSRKAMEDATPEYLRWGAIRSMHQPLAAGTAESIVWDENGALLRAKIVDDQEWRKVQAGVYKGFSIGVRPELVRGNSVEKLTWVENSLVDRPKDPDAIFTVARAEGFDPEAEFECEVEEPVTLEQTIEMLRSIREADRQQWNELERMAMFNQAPVERIADGIQSAPAGEPGAEPIQAGDCTITREGPLFVLNGPDGALIGKFETEVEARQRAAEVADAMKDGPGGKDDATDQHGKTLVLPTDRAEEPTIAEDEEVKVHRTEDGRYQLIRASNDEVLCEVEKPEEMGAWVREHTRAVTATTPSLPVRENLEGKTPKEERASDDKSPEERAKDPGHCSICGTVCARCSETRADEPEVERTDDANDPVIPESSTPPDSTLTIARLETDNAALILRAETAETELARVQTAQEVLTRDLASAKEQIQRLSDMPAPQQPLRFAHAVSREFFANAKLDHDGETARITTRMNEITSQPATSDLGEQAARAQEYQLLKLKLAGRG